jgi:hypothetical protein
VLKEIAGAPAIPAPGLHHFFCTLTIHPRPSTHASPPDQGGTGASGRKSTAIENFIATWRIASDGAARRWFKRTARRIAAHLSTDLKRRGRHHAHLPHDAEEALHDAEEAALCEGQSCTIGLGAEIQAR